MLTIDVISNANNTQYKFSNEKDCLIFWRNIVSKDHSLDGRSMDLTKRIITHIGKSII